LAQAASSIKTSIKQSSTRKPLQGLIKIRKEKKDQGIYKTRIQTGFEMQKPPTHEKKRYKLIWR